MILSLPQLCVFVPKPNQTIGEVLLQPELKKEREEM